MTITAEQLAQLREAAERATCGRWELSFPCDSDSATIDREVEGFIPICVVEGAHPDGGYDEDFQSEQQANAEFIAAFHPAVALALLDELERKEKKKPELKSYYEGVIADGSKRIAELERLAEAESVGADKAASSVVEWMKRCQAAENRISELEARTVTVAGIEIGEAVEFSGGAIVVPLSVVRESLTAAGINLTVEG